MHSNNLLPSLSNQSEQTFLERNADDIDRITIFADISEGFTIGFVEVNLERDRTMTIQALQSQSSDIQWIPIYFDHQDLRYLIAETTKALQSVTLIPDRKPVLILCGLEHAIGGYGDYPDILSNLNIARDSYTDKLPYPILFLLPNYALNRFAKFAPDFYAWKSMEVRLQSEIPKSENSHLELTLIPEHQRIVPVPPARFDFLYHLLEQYRQPSLGRADLLDQLGDAYVSHVEYAKAEPAYCEALKLYKDFQNLLNEAHVLNNLASLYKLQGSYGKAEPFFLRSLEIREQQLGADHSDTAASLNDLAELYRMQGRYSEAEPLYLRSLRICEQQLGADHFDTATSLNNLALLYESQGRYGKAEPLFLRSLQIYEKQLGSVHPSTASSLNNLALLYESQGRYSEAEPLCLRSLQISEQQFGADHPDTANSLINLAGLYYKQGRNSEAEPLYLRALQIYEQQLGADHPNTATNLNNLANLYYEQGRYSEAELLYQQVIQILEKVLGSEHPNTVIVRENYALLCMMISYKIE